MLPLTPFGCVSMRISPISFGTFNAQLLHSRSMEPYFSLCADVSSITGTHFFYYTGLPGLQPLDSNLKALSSALVTSKELTLVPVDFYSQLLAQYWKL